MSPLPLGDPSQGLPSWVQAVEAVARAGRPQLCSLVGEGMEGVINPLSASFASGGHARPSSGHASGGGNRAAVYVAWPHVPGMGHYPYCFPATTTTVMGACLCLTSRRCLGCGAVFSYGAGRQRWQWQGSCRGSALCLVHGAMLHLQLHHCHYHLLARWLTTIWQPRWRLLVHPG